MSKKETTVGNAVLGVPDAEGIGPPSQRDGGSPTSVKTSVPKSRGFDSFSLKGEAFGRGPNLLQEKKQRWMRDKGFSPPRGRSCHPLALRNQWMTDVGAAAGGIGFCESKSQSLPGEKMTASHH